MNINDGLHGLPEALGVSKASPVSATQTQQQASLSAPASGIQDRTEVSTAASLAHQAMSIPDVRMDKVAAIQQALASGSYQVNPGYVADKLIGQMKGE
ncbi:flagellar biosynthesis anti-sigma factor FlgM [Alloacidobacterium dinghuense]|uniref:Negative regulator of flagellin synthesis n=1 Tax=Alloacidobacterium dinghuense TaxID=2763107 RepID=A0A7G8BNM2_9BACT|nr:flagellar biosynthesis anti-sigma factor FlgM [Alloacidobacterium dinghuense]QNI34142.1 flagellar biosynthesis anti-sigma factor FlgM [Alloacidobacterium dinghuense]